MEMPNLDTVWSSWERKRILQLAHSVISSGVWTPKGRDSRSRTGPGLSLLPELRCQEHSPQDSLQTAWEDKMAEKLSELSTEEAGGAESGQGVRGTGTWQAGTGTPGEGLGDTTAGLGSGLQQGAVRRAQAAPPLTPLLQLLRPLCQFLGQQMFVHFELFQQQGLVWVEERGKGA